MKKLTKVLIALLAVACIPATLAACDGFGTPSTSSSVETPALEKVVLDKTTASMDLYETLTLTATLENVTGDIVWSTSDESKATVVDGVVTALAEGEVTITAAVGEISAQCVITIESSGQMPVLSVNSDNVSLMVGQEFTITSVLNYKGQNLSATFGYATSDPSIATVENGKIKAVATGSTTIIVSVEYNGFEDTKVVAVKVTEDVLLEASESEIVLGTVALSNYVTSKTVTTTVKVSGAAVENAQVVWAVENDAVATVDGGVITAVGAGETTVSVTYTSEKGNAFTVYVKVIVEKPIVAEELEDNLVDIDADDSDTVELKVNSEGLVQILDKNNDNAVLSYTLVDGKVMLNKSDLTVSKRTLLVEYTDVIYEVVVFITTERVTLLSFATETDLENISFYWEGPQTMALDTEVVAEGDTASLKITYTQEQGWNYLLLKTPFVTDISLYDFIEFKVYNPTSNAFSIQPTWGTGVTVAANGWTDVRFLLSEFADGKITDMAGTPISAGNISNLPICFYGNGFVADQAFYISSIEAGKFERVVEEVAENVVAKFTAEADLTTVSSFWAHVYGLSIDTTFAYGEEKGSLKATVGSPNGNGYLILNAPILTDVSAYDYISFWVYNAGSADVNIGTLWNATPAKVGEWTQFTFSADVLNTTTDMDGNALSTSNITNLVLWITGGDALVAGDALYFSTITAEREPVAENVVAQFRNEEDVNQVSQYWDLYNFSIDTNKVYGNEKGSLKVEVKAANGSNYIILSAPLKTDVSEYDYITFWVYSDISFGFGTLWDAKMLTAGEWTQVTFPASLLNTTTDMNGAAISTSDITNLVLWCHTTEGLAVGDCFYISTITAGNEAIADNVVAKFDKSSDTSQVSQYWDLYNFSVDTNKVYGDEKGSLKVEVKAASGSNYIILSAPLKTDVSEYDYITFWVYSDISFGFGTLWDAKMLTAGEWTQITFPAALLNSTTDMGSNALSTSDITNLVLWCHTTEGLAVGDCFYISTITAGLNPVVESNIVAKFESEADLNNVSSYWPTVYALSIDTEMKHGDDKGSLKATVGELNANGYISITNPLNKNVSKYDYVSFWVYNGGAADIDVGTLWTGFKVKSGEWTEIRLPANVLNGADTMFGTKVSMEDLTNMVIWIIGGDKLTVGDALYFSSITAGENEVAENVITNFKDNSSLNQVSVYWADACTASIDTEIKYEGEEASLKYTYNQEQNFNYIILNAPLNADVSAYDYIAFYVYNPTEHVFTIQPTWGTGVEVAANGWTLVKINLAEFNGETITDMSGAPVVKNNITNLPLCIYGSGFVAGESIYFSSFFAGNYEA